MRYQSYTGTRGMSRPELEQTLRSSDRIAVMIVASVWENDHGKFWAAYIGDGDDVGNKSLRSHVAETGSKLPRKVAEGLFPQLVAAGYEWWD